MNEQQRLGKWEIQILDCVKTKSLAEKQIAKLIGLDISIVSPMITDLIMHGYLEIVTKRRLYFFFRKSCTLTSDGLAALESAKRNPWDGVVKEIRNRIFEIITEARGQSHVIDVTWHVANAGYKTAKFILSR